jgi:hypothetical protein
MNTPKRPVEVQVSLDHDTCKILKETLRTHVLAARRQVCAATWVSVQDDPIFQLMKSLEERLEPSKWLTFTELELSWLRRGLTCRIHRELEMPASSVRMQAAMLAASALNDLTTA